MKKGLRFLVLIVFILGFKSMCVANEVYTIVPMPDTIVQNTPLDAAVYNNTAEFFTPYIVNELNKTQFIKSPTVNDVRSKIQADYWLNKSTAKVMDDFRRFYKLDFTHAKKISAIYNTNYVLLVTSATDSTNYITRRTWWDFFNIAGASVLDPAYKINIYAVLIDTDKDLIVWSQTYQKTISVVENRIVPVGYAPQTEQLQKIKDYSVYLAPRVAQGIQNTLLTQSQKAVEANLIHTDYGSIDNVFTKKYRGLRKEIKDATVVPAAKTREGYGVAKEKYNELKKDYQNYRERKQEENLENSKTESKILPINFFKKEKAVDSPSVEEVPTQKEQTVDTVKNSAEQAVESVKTTIQEIPPKTQEVINEIKSSTTTTVENVQKQIETQVENVKTIAAPKIEATQNTAKEIKTNIAKTTNDVGKKVEEKAVTIPADIEKQSKSLLNKVFKFAPMDDDKDLPVDSTIYTHPTNYRTNDYLPVRPRLREITTDDTYNAF